MKLLLPFAMIAAMWAGCGELAKLKEPSSGGPSSGDNPAANRAAKPAIDREAVKRELIDLANEITTAAKDGDVSFLAKVSTEDFQFTDIDGKVKSKNKTLAEVKEERALRSFEITDEKLVTVDESSAVLSYTLKVTAKNGRTAKAATTDTYVREDGKWLIKSQQQTLLR